MLCVALLVVACQTTKPTELATKACDVLVDIITKKETNAYLVKNDRVAAVGLARHKGRITEYNCPTEVTSHD